MEVQIWTDSVDEPLALTGVYTEAARIMKRRA